MREHDVIKVLPPILAGLLSFFVSGCNDHSKQASKEGGQITSRLDWFEIEITPHEFRIGIGPDKTGLIAYKPSGSEKFQTLVLPPESNTENCALIMRSLETLLTKLDIESIPQHEPDKFFLNGPAREEPAMYVRFVHSNRVWQSRFSTNEIPVKMKALYKGCRDLAIEVCDRSQKRQMSSEEVLEIKDKPMVK
jgi:hypothetical protein